MSIAARMDRIQGVQYGDTYKLFSYDDDVDVVKFYDPESTTFFSHTIGSMDYDMVSMLAEDILLLSSYEDGITVILMKEGLKIFTREPRTQSWCSCGDGKHLALLDNQGFKIFSYDVAQLREELLNSTDTTIPTEL